MTLLSRQNLLLITLVLAVLASALGLIYVKDLNRRLFIRLQQLQSQNNQLRIDWGKLLLEQGAKSNPARVQQIAENRLNMQLPPNRDVVLLKLPQKPS